MELLILLLPVSSFWTFVSAQWGITRQTFLNAISWKAVFAYNHVEMCSLACNCRWVSICSPVMISFLRYVCVTRHLCPLNEILIEFQIHFECIPVIFAMTVRPHRNYAHARCVILVWTNFRYDRTSLLYAILIHFIYFFLIPRPNTSKCTQNCHHIADDIFNCIYMADNLCILIEISLTFVSVVVTKIKNHWFRL